MRQIFIFLFFIGTIVGSVIFNFFNGDKYLITISLIILIFLSCFFDKRVSVSIFIITVSILMVLFVGNKNFPVSKNTDFIGTDTTVVGRINSEPDKRESNTRLVIKLDYFESDEARTFSSEKIIATVSNFSDFSYGQKVKVYGKLQIPENFVNENGIEFNYKKFLAKDRIYSLFYYPKIEILESRSPFSLNAYIFKVKKIFIDKMNKIFPSPEAELLGGILLGVKRSLGPELEENFRKVGLVHIIVLSGYNVTIIADAIFKFFSFLPRALSTTLGVISVLIFCIMVGSGATVVRSTIMTLLAIFARISGKTYSVNRALLFAGSIMMIINPLILFYDPSFQLSFLATIGLVNLNKIVGKIIFFVPEKFNFKEISTATLSTQITVLPLLMKMTGQLSVVAPVVNIITLQFIPITMLFGFLSTVVAFINEKLGIIVAFLPFLFLKYILFIVNYFAEFNFATISI